jgi:nucleoside-diphosphate kinase
MISNFALKIGNILNMVTKTEKSLVLIKPDGIKRQLAGLCLTKLESLGLELAGAKVVKVSERLVNTHYAHLKARPFFDELILETVDQKVLAFVFTGKNAVEKIRNIVGATNPEKSKEGTLRNSFGRIRNGLIENVIHASSTASDGEREVKLWFSKSELVN